MATIGGKTFADLGLKIEQSYQHRVAPSTRDYTLDIPGRHGKWDFGADMGPRDFLLPCQLHQADQAGLQVAINALNDHLFDATGRPKTMKLVFDYEPEKYYMVRYSGGLPVSRVIGIGRFSLPLVAFDPFSYLIALNKEITWESKEITFESRAIKWGSRGGDEQYFPYPGYYYAWSNGSRNVRPIVTITGSADKLTLSANGETLSMDAFTNDQIIIDGPTYSVTKSGNHALSFVSGITGFNLTPGENPIWVDGANLDVAISVVFRDQYL